ncbi:MAG: hypothetical protein AMS23_06350 [Bacteroides sp. SM1_62]|nr:MAG: hypothetical protein AMS23_06350 [Bacteroides sp. SM1_62]
MNRISTIALLTVALAACCAPLPLFGCPAGGEDDPGTKPKKYVAFSTDKEAYFMPRDFEHFQGEYTRQITEVCQKYNVPFTWLIVVDEEHIEVRTSAAKLFPDRRDIDEFSLHVHFKWFIVDDPDDFESFKMVERRMQWLADAKSEIEKGGLPMPRSFRYGGGDSNDSLYYIEDLIFLSDEFGIKNFLFGPDRLNGVIGITRYEHKGDNVWVIDGGREITLLSTCVYLDEDEKTIYSAIDQRLRSADYAIIGSHDYREAVPEHMAMAIEYLNANYNIEYVTIDRIGELVRSREICNDW